MLTRLGRFLSSLFLLMGVVVITSATSYKRPNSKPYIKDYWVTSTCPGAFDRPEFITTNDDHIVNPSGVTFKRYGFPNEEVFVGQTTTSSSPGTKLICEKEPRKSMDADHVYVCHDEKSISCIITFSSHRPLNSH